MLKLNEEQALLRDSVRRYLADKSPESVVRALMETGDGFDRAAWKAMADELGLQALIIPERHGGLGLSQLELCLVFEEMGRVLLCAPFFSTVALATNLLLVVGDEQACGDYLPGIATGDRTATLAYGETGAAWDPASIRVAASQAGDGWTLTGAKSYVIDGHTADTILVIARAPFGIGVFAVDGRAAGLTRTARATLDMTRKLADLRFEAVGARLVGHATDQTDAIGKAIDFATIALTAEQIGGSQHLLDMAVEYAKFRVQFGRPIGSFQAIKHKCADLLMEIESAKAAAHEGYRVAAADAPELAVCASIAKAYCSETYFRASTDNIQIHGGIGFTWEHPSHLYFKRAKSSEMLFGDSDFHRERYLRIDRTLATDRG